MLPKWDRQDDCVGLERILQRLGNDRGSNRPSLRRQLFGRPTARDGYVDVFTGEGEGEGLAYLAESYNRIAHRFLQSMLKLLSCQADPVSALATAHSFKSADLRRPSCRHPRTALPRLHNWIRLKQGTARQSRFPQADPSCPAGSWPRTCPSLPW